MQTGVKQVFYFNAGATSLGGYLEEPFRYVTTPCSASLSPTGGISETRNIKFAYEKVLTCESSSTSVTGRPLALNGPWEQTVVSVVKGLNLLGRITIGSMTAAVRVVHPPLGGGPRRITFLGSHFEDVRVDRHPVTLSMNPGLLPSQAPRPTTYSQTAPSSPAQPEIAWPQLWPMAYKQASTMLGYGRVPQWLHDRYSWMTQTKNPEQPNPAGYSLCSLVDKIDGLASGPVVGHAFELKDLGRVFLGEVMVHPQQASLTMLRAELGCPVKGHISASFAVSNGSTCPPSFFGQDS